LKIFSVVSIPGCIWCDRVKEFLKMHGVSFKEVTLTSKDEQKDFCMLWGVKTFPQVFILDEDTNHHIGGHDDTMDFISAGNYL
jgi:glutaredoxin